MKNLKQALVLGMTCGLLFSPAVFAEDNAGAPAVNAPPPSTQVEKAKVRQDRKELKRHKKVKVEKKEIKSDKQSAGEATK